MAFLTSPGINVSEIDATTSVPAVSTTVGAIAGVFRWGPINQPILVDSENTLVKRFGKPTVFNTETWFSASDFLSYAGGLFVTRVVSESARNAGAAAVISNREQADALTDTALIARYPGALGNSIEVSVCPSAAAYSSSDLLGFAAAVGSNTATITARGTTVVGDIVRIGSPSIGYQDLKVTAISETTVTFDQKIRLLDLTGITVTRFWGKYKTISQAPAAGKIHIVVTDATGLISGAVGGVLEVHPNVSVIAGSKNADGATSYYKEVINTRSGYLWATGADLLATGAATYTVLAGGLDGEGEGTVSIAAIAKGFDTFKDKDTIDVSLIIQGKARGTTLAEYLISEIADTRQDCVVFLSPPKELVVGNSGNEALDIVSYISTLTPSSRGVMDSGYKYRYDKYNDTYVYTPLNGDIAGLTARTDLTRDPWFAPAGYNRGSIKNVIRLAFNPNQAERDLLYPANINPVITQPGEGTLLFGDKTMLGDGSAFSRIGVRRLFIVLRKAVARSLKPTLWEMNDEFTRSNFKNMVDPFLRDIQGRRGILDFKVVCDTTNNTPEVIDRNEFVAEIYVKPSRSINYIQLNLIAVRTGVEFAEVVGQV